MSIIKNSRSGIAIIILSLVILALVTILIMQKLAKGKVMRSASVGNATVSANLDKKKIEILKSAKVNLDKPMAKTNSNSNSNSNSNPNPNLKPKQIVKTMKYKLPEIKSQCFPNPEKVLKDLKPENYAGLENIELKDIKALGEKTSEAFFAKSRNLLFDLMSTNFRMAYAFPWELRPPEHHMLKRSSLVDSLIRENFKPYDTKPKDESISYLGKWVTYRANTVHRAVGP